MPAGDVQVSQLVARVRAALAESAGAQRATAPACASAIAQAAARLADTFRAGGRLLAFGNGGSAADAQHLAAELAGRFERERPGLPALASTANTSDLTAIGNDYGFDVTARIQESHIAVIHLLCELVDAQLFPEPERG